MTKFLAQILQITVLTVADRPSRHSGNVWYVARGGTAGYKWAVGLDKQTAEKCHGKLLLSQALGYRTSEIARSTVIAPFKIYVTNRKPV